MEASRTVRADAARSERLDAGAGVAFVVLVFVSSFIAGEPPNITDPAADLRQYYLDERDTLQAGGFIGGLGIIAFFWFLGALRAHLRRAEGGDGRFSAIAFGSGIALAALVLAASAIGVAPTLHVREFDDATLRVFYDTQWYMFVFTAFPVAALAAATSAIALRTRSLPTWLSALGGVLALWSVVAALSLYGESDSFLSIGGEAGLTAFLLFLVWVLATSIVLMIRERVQAADYPPTR